jgi:electron transport complex protein RnfD
MTDVMIAIMPLYAMAVYFYGMRPLYLLLISMITSIVTGFCCTLLRKRIPNIHDLSNLVTAMIVPLLFPATVQLEIVVAATVFALAVVKYPFGGLDRIYLILRRGDLPLQHLLGPKKSLSTPCLLKRTYLILLRI